MRPARFPRIVPFACAAALIAGCGSNAHTTASTRAAPRPVAPIDPKQAQAAEMARERLAASYERPPAAALAAAGRTPAARLDRARAELLRAAADIHRYGRAHGTFAIGPVSSLHRLDPGTELVDFVDGRQTSFFIAVEPPSTTAIWRYDYDHNSGSVACEPAAVGGCPRSRRW